MLKLNKPSLIRNKKLFNNFKLWINKFNEDKYKDHPLNSKQGWFLIDIDGFFGNWKTGARALLEVKNYTGSLSNIQKIEYAKLDKLCKNHGHEVGWNYKGYFCLYMDRSSPEDSTIMEVWKMDDYIKRLINVEQLIDILSFKDEKVFKPVIRNYN